MEEGMKKCPACAEEIKSEAKKCRYCGEIFGQITTQKDKENEIIIYNGKANWSNYIAPIIIVITLYLFPVGIYYIYYHKNKVIQLTNKKFTYTYGIISKKQIDIRIEKIESVQIKKSLIDRMFGSGTVIISGTGGNNEPIVGIDKPEELKNKLEGIIH